MPLPAAGRTEGDRRSRSRQRVAAFTLLYHPDLDRVGERARLSSLTPQRPVLLSRLEPGFAPPGSARRRALGDPYISRKPVVLVQDGDEGLSLHRGSSQMVLEVDGETLEGERTLSPRELERGVILELAQRVVLLLHLLPEEIGPSPPRFGLVGESEAIVRLRHEIARVADLEVPVLLRGETGTGKELVAQAIHQASRRAHRIYLSVNLGAVPPSLAASELFGAVKGAFTGAAATREGYFDRADGGVLFLDEVGEAPAEVQVLLLRVLENGEIQPVGARQMHAVDVRVLCATDADLEKAVEESRFRAPLLHRLASYEILLPRLWERRDDLGRLFVHFLREEMDAIGERFPGAPAALSDPPWLPASVFARLAQHPWPGNVRQLRNAVRQLAIDSRGGGKARVGPQVERLLREAETGVMEVVKVASRSLGTDTPPPAGLRGSYRRPSEVDDEELLATLRRHRFRLKPTAEALGISRPSLYDLINHHPRIRKAADLERNEIEAALAAHGGDLRKAAGALEVSESGLRLRLRRLGLL